MMLIFVACLRLLFGVGRLTFGIGLCVVYHPSFAFDCGLLYFIHGYLLIGLESVVDCLSLANCHCAA